MIRGKHQIAFGVDFIRTQNNTYAGYKENGSFFFGTNSALSSGDGLADLMLGALSEYDQSRPQQTAYRETIPGFYAQDTIKLNSRLTFNIGLRWEPMLYATDYFERGSQFSMAAFLAGTHSTVYPNGAGRHVLLWRPRRTQGVYQQQVGELLAAPGPRGESSRRRTGHHPRRHRNPLQYAGSLVLPAAGLQSAGGERNRFDRNPGGHLQQAVCELSGRKSVPRPGAGAKERDIPDQHALGSAALPT